MFIIIIINMVIIIISPTQKPKKRSYVLLSDYIVCDRLTHFNLTLQMTEPVCGAFLLLPLKSTYEIVQLLFWVVDNSGFRRKLVLNICCHAVNRIMTQIHI
jgi:hypothetical protein